jgi:hypothetical protein
MPKRRHWRWLVVGILVLCAVAVLGLNHFSSIDSRFVGVWEDTNETRDPAKRDTLELLSTGIAYYGVSGQRRSMWTTWTVKGDILQLGDPPDAPLVDAKIHAAQWLNEKTGDTWLPYGNTFVVEAVTQDEFRGRVGDGDNAEHYVFRRLGN